MANTIVEGPEGHYWQVIDEDGNIIATCAYKEEADLAAEGKPWGPPQSLGD